TLNLIERPGRLRYRWSNEPKYEYIPRKEMGVRTNFFLLLKILRIVIQFSSTEGRSDQ
ncbi:4494_t:CDS:1, partial [Racocetra persica]